MENGEGDGNGNGDGDIMCDSSYFSSLSIIILFSFVSLSWSNY